MARGDGLKEERDGVESDGVKWAIVPLVRDTKQVGKRVTITITPVTHGVGQFWMGF
jgi:hypothetical protein